MRLPSRLLGRIFNMHTIIVNLLIAVSYCRAMSLPEICQYWNSQGNYVHAAMIGSVCNTFIDLRQQTFANTTADCYSLDVPGTLECRVGLVNSMADVTALIDNNVTQLYDIYFVGLERLENLDNATADIRTGWYRQNSNETYTPYSSAFWMQPLPTQPSDINISDVTAAMYAGGFNGIFPVDPDKYYVFATGMLCQCDPSPVIAMTTADPPSATTSVSNVSSVGQSPPPSFGASALNTSSNSTINGTTVSPITMINSNGTTLANTPTTIMATTTIAVTVAATTKSANSLVIFGFKSFASRTALTFGFLLYHHYCRLNYP